MSALRTPSEAAEWCNITTRTLARMRKAGTGPAFVALSDKTVRYRQADLDAWLAERRVAPRGDRAALDAAVARTIAEAPRLSAEQIDQIAQILSQVGEHRVAV